MNNFPKISVIMLNYNGLKYLKETVPAILELDYPNFEFIIVDNGSSDGSIEFIKSVKKVQLINSPKIREKNFACNLAVGRATGIFILLLDNDILILEKEILRSLIGMFNTARNIGQIGLCLINRGDTRVGYYGMYFNLLGTVNLPSVLLEDLTNFKKKEIGFASGAGIFIKKDVWNEVGGYDEHFVFGGDDSDLGIKLWLSGYRNYLYAATCHEHIGMSERVDNIKYSYKLRKSVHAFSCTIVKNYTIVNMCKYLSVFFFFTLLKSIKQSIRRSSLLPMLSLLGGWHDFCKDIPRTMIKRKYIQKNRKIKTDVFLKIKPPKVSAK